MEIKACPFCGNEKANAHSFGNVFYLKCEGCNACGPDGKNEEEAIERWNSAPRKEDAEMEKNCLSCKYNLDGYCSSVPPYKSFKVHDHLCCTDWESKEPEPAPLNFEDFKGLNPFIPEAIEVLEYVRQEESLYNRMQQLAEEAAELAQAVLKYNRAMGFGCYTPMSPKDANDAMVEEMADVLLCMEAAFPHCPGNMDFYSNLARVYREKAERWAERLKEHDD